MADSSYLAQALAQMSAGVQPQTQGQGPDLLAMKKMADQAAAWKLANPGQSYLGHEIGQAGKALAAVPGNLAAVPGNLAGLFTLGGR